MTKNGAELIVGNLDRPETLTLRKLMELQPPTARIVRDGREEEAPRGFVKTGWCGDQACEDVIRERTGTSPRVMPLDDTPKGDCLVCGKPATATMYYPRAY